MYSAPSDEQDDELCNKFVDETQIEEDIRRYVQAISSRYSVAGSGDDGIVFTCDNSDRYAIKIFYPMSAGRAAAEVTAMSALREAGSIAAPEIFRVGHIGPYRAMIRTNCEDIEEEYGAFKVGTVSELMWSIHTKIESAQNDGLDSECIAEMVDDAVTDFMLSGSYLGEEDNVLDVIQNDPRLNRDSLIAFSDMCSKAKELGIPVKDISVSNFGIDVHTGHLVVRDMSRFTEDTNFPHCDFSSDLSDALRNIERLNYKPHGCSLG